MLLKIQLFVALLAALATVAHAGSCPTDQWGNTAITESCTCGVGATDACPVGQYCYGTTLTCESTQKSHSGCNTELTKSSPISGDPCDCHGTTCVPDKYCWSEGPSNKCRDTAQPPRQRCSAGFTGVNGNQHTDSTGCPSGFTARGPDDMHDGVGMDFKDCCYAACNTQHTTCPNIAGKTVTPIDDSCYATDSSPPYCQANSCCKLQCKNSDHFAPSLCVGNKFSKSHGDCSSSGCTASECCQEPGMCFLWGQDQSNTCPEGKTPKSKEDGSQCSGSQTSASDNCNADQCCQEPSGCDGGDDAGPAENVCKCETGGTSQLCAEGQYCSTDDDTSTCTNEKPVKNKPTSECGANPNAATAPMTNEAAAAKIQKLKDLEAWFRMNFAATKMHYMSAESLTACKEISTKWKDAACSSKTCDSSDSANTACCKSGSDETSSKCEDSESEWRKSVGAKGPGGNEFEGCCDTCIYDSLSSKQSFKDKCTPNEWGSSTGPVVCNKYKKDDDEKSYCGNPVKFLNTDSNPHVEPVTDGMVEIKPEGSCNMLAADIDKLITLFKASKLTQDSTYKAMYDYHGGLSDADKTTWEKPYQGLGQLFLSAPVVAGAENPGNLEEDDDSYEKASIFVPDFRDKDCQECAFTLNHATLSGNLDARGGTAYIHRAVTLVGSKILVAGSVSLWGMSIINAAEISGTTTGDVFLYKIINSGTIKIENVKGAVIQDVVNTGTIVLTDVIGNGIDISNKAGGTIDFKGTCKVNMNFRKVEAGSTVTFSADTTGKMGVPEADMGNISPPSGVTKEKYTPPAEDPLAGGVDGSSVSGLSPSSASSGLAHESSTSRVGMSFVVVTMTALAFFSHIV